MLVWIVNPKVNYYFSSVPSFSMLYVSAFRRFFSYKVVSQGMLLLWFALFLCGQELVAQISAPASSVVAKPTKSIQQGSATVKKGGVILPL